MNKQERLLSIILGLALAGWLYYANQQAVKQRKAAAERAAEAATNVVAQASAAAATTTDDAALAAAPENTAAADVAEPVKVTPATPEQVVLLEDGEMKVAVSSHGAVLKRVALNQYLTNPGAASEENPPLVLDFAAAPALELSGVPGLAANASYAVTEPDEQGKIVTLATQTEQGLAVTRRIELLDHYQIKVTDTVRNVGDSVMALGTNSVSMGMMARGASNNEILSIDSLAAAERAKVHYWDKDSSAKTFLSPASGGFIGCGGKRSAVGMADHVTIPLKEPQAWVALKSRFFVTGFSSSATNCGVVARISRDTEKPTYELEDISARVLFVSEVLGPGETRTREYQLYVGPKKLSLLQQMGNGMDAVMQFGFFTWFCKLMVPTLNFFYRIIPSYGIAIILLTFLVRIIFWPLTHKSTQSMKKMQEIQPLLKEIQKKFKDNPQKMQQETMAVYRDNKVNPLSSCLPMLIQIPVFIALFTVLRSAVELRYAPFLWIGDLSEPENLLKGILPIPLNILPILMAATMALQSYLTPTAGDPQQQKMMMVMMPVMMLVMFYSFPSALSLYWTVSQVLSIVQMWMIRRRGQQHSGGDGDGMTVERPPTRQQRRRGAANA